MSNLLPPPFKYTNRDTGKVIIWTPIEARPLRKGGEVIVCNPKGAFFNRADCVNKTRERGVVTVDEKGAMW